MAKSAGKRRKSSSNPTPAPINGGSRVARGLEGVQAEFEELFCPAVDSTVIAMLLLEIDIDDDYAVSRVRRTLEQLQLTSLAQCDIEDQRLTCPPTPDDSSACHFSTADGVEYLSPISSSSTSPLDHEFGSTDSDSVSTTSSSPLSFLQAIFPDVDQSALEAAMGSAFDDYGLDMAEVVERILTEEFVREEAERGNVPPAAVKKKKKGKRESTVTFSIVDVLQRQHAPATTSAPAGPSVDPWTHVTSVATYLSQLLPETPPTRFQSLFRDPQYTTHAQALRAHLGSLSTPTKNFNPQAFLELLQLPDGALEALQRQDALSCLKATRGDIDKAFELVWFLWEIEGKGSSGHGPAAPPAVLILPAPPDSPWTTVTRAKTASKPPAPTPSLPSAKSAHELPVQSEGLSVGQCRTQVDFYHRKWVEAVQAASSQWRKRNRGERSKDVASYYAEQAREYGAKKRAWALNEARALVDRQQRNAGDAYSIDLHGLTVHESTVIVRERLNIWWSSEGAGGIPSKSMRIITGMGRHSKGQVGVLAPAVGRMLKKEGWDFKETPGVLTVVGVRR